MNTQPQKQGEAVTPGKNKSVKESLENSIEKLKKSISDMESNLFASCERIKNMKIELHEARDIAEKSLRSIPQIRREKARLRLKTALLKYGEPLKQEGVNPSLTDFIVNKRVERILGRTFRLNLAEITRIEKELGIFSGFSEANADLFTKLHELLAGTRDLDKLEVIMRKVRLNIKSPSEAANAIRKEDTIRYFTEAAGFEEADAVMELLSHKNLSEAIRDNVVTEKTLKNEIKKLEGEMGKISRFLVTTVKKKNNAMRNIVGDGITSKGGFFSDYVLSPVTTTASVLGTLIILFFLIGRYAAEPLGKFLPSVGELLSNTGLPAISRLASPLYTILVSVSLILIGVTLKRINDSIRKKKFIRRLNA